MGFPRCKGTSYSEEVCLLADMWPRSDIPKRGSLNH
jgi:hypothetical protein